MTITMTDSLSLRQYLANEAVTITRLVYNHRPGRTDTWTGWGSVYDATMQKDMAVRVTLFPEDRAVIERAGFDTSRWDYTFKRRISEPDFPLYQWEQFTVIMRWTQAHGWRINEVQKRSGVEWIAVVEQSAPAPAIATPERVVFDDILPGDVVGMAWGHMTVLSRHDNNSWICDNGTGSKRLLTRRNASAATVVSRVERPAPAKAQTTIEIVQLPPLLPAPRIVGLLPSPRSEYDYSESSYPKYVFPAWVTPAIASDWTYRDTAQEYVSTYLKYVKIAASRENRWGTDIDTSARHALWAQQAVLQWLYGVKLYGVSDHSGIYRYTLARSMYIIWQMVGRLIAQLMAELIALIANRAGEGQS